MVDHHTTLAELEAKVAAWVSTPEGMQALVETAERARKAAEAVGRQAVVTAEMLGQRVTI